MVRCRPGWHHSGDQRFMSGTHQHLHGTNGGSVTLTSHSYFTVTTHSHTHTHTLHSLLHLPKSPSLTLGNSGEVPHFAHTPRHTTLSQHTDTTLTAQPNHPHTTLQLGLGWQKYVPTPTYLCQCASVLVCLTGVGGSSLRAHPQDMLQVEY